MKLYLILLSVFLSLSIAFAKIAEVDSQRLSVSYPENGGFENGKVGWSNSGGVFALSTTTASIAEGKVAATFDAASAGNYLRTSGDLQSLFPLAWGNSLCSVEVRYKGDASLYKFQVLNSSLSVVYTEDLESSVSSFKTAQYTNLPCSSISSLQIISTGDGALISVDAFKVDYLKPSSVLSSSSDSSEVNFLTNPSFEAGIQGWTATGLTASVKSFSSASSGDKKYVQLVATSASQTFCSDLMTVPENISGGGAYEFSYTASGTLFKSYITDGTNKVTVDQSLSDQTKWTKISTSSFLLSTTHKLCIESLGAGTLKLNKAYVGTNKRVGYIPLDSSLIGEIKYLPENVAPVGFIPAMGSSIGYNAGTYQGSAYYQLYKKLWNVALNTAGQPYYLSTTKGSTADADWLAGKTITIDESGLFTRVYKSGTTNGVGQLQSDAFQGHWHQLPFNTDVKFAPGGTIANVNASAGARAYYSAQDIVAGNIIADGTNGTPRIAAETRPTNVAKYAFIRYSPYMGAESVQTPEQAEWFIDANIGGANINLGVAAQTSYITMSDASLDMILNNGSSLAQISCSGAESSGLTCSGASEHIGVSFIPPYTGYFEACFDFSFYTNNSTTAGAAFQLAQTDIGATILAEGGSKVYTQSETVASSSQKVCGQFKFSDTAKKNIKLVFEKPATTSGPTILADRSSSSGQRDIHITVRPLLQNSLRAILTGDQVTSKNKSKVHLFSLLYGQSGSLGASCTSSPCGVSSIGDEAISVTRLSTGSYRVFLDKTYSKVSCTYIGYSSTSSMILMGRSDTDLLGCENSCSYINVYSYNSSSTLTDGNGRMICHAIE